MCVCVAGDTEENRDRGTTETEAECLLADKEVIVHVLRLIAALLHPKLAAAKTSTSTQAPGVNFTIKTSMANKN